MTLPRLRTLAVIPARGGSKRLPRKTVLPLHGKPLLAWVVEAAARCGSLDRVICSTDDDEIAEAARAHGCEVPFKRPAELASDTATTIDVLLHAVDTLERSGDRYDRLVLLQCTSPLTTALHIEKALELHRAAGRPNLVSVCPADHPPAWMLRLDQSGALHPLLDPELLNARSQDHPPAFRPNGAVFVAEVENLRRAQSFHDPAPTAYLMRREDSVDIDDRVDFLLAEVLLRLRLEEVERTAVGVPVIR